MKIIDATSKNINRYKVVKNFVEVIRENLQRSESFGSEVIGIVLHWTAGWYHQAYDGYHFNIAFQDNEVIVMKTLNSTEKGQHLFGRNTGMIGISLCCLAKPDVSPKPEMLDALSLLIAEISAWKKLDFKDIELPKKKLVGERLVDVPGQTIKVNSVTDHAEFSKYDYPGHRFDVGTYKAGIIKKAKEYYKELKDGKRQFTFLEIIK